MAIAFVAARGSGASGTSGTTLAVVWAVAVAVGEQLLLRVAADNINNVDGNNNEHVSCVDDKGNTYVKLAEWTNGGGGAGAGITVSIWLCNVQVAQSGTTTATVTFASAIVDKTALQEEFSVAAGKMLQAVGSPVTAEVNGAVGFGSSTISGLSSLARLYYRAMAKEANSIAALTPTTNFTNLLTGRSRNNALAVLCTGEYRLNTSTGETSNPTFAVTGDTVSAFIALEEVDIPVTYIPTLSMSLMGVGS